MATRTQQIKLIAFLVVAAVVLLGLLLAVVGRGFWDRTYTYYVRTTEGVQGLQEGSTVTVEGVRAGSVEGFHLFPEGHRGVEVEISVDRDVPIPRGSQALLKFEGVTGLKLVDITGGSLKRGVLEPGSTLPLGETTIERLEEKALSLLERSDTLLANLVDLTDEETLGRLDAVLARATGALAAIEAAADATAGAARAGERGARRALGSVTAAAEEAEQAFSESREAIGAARGTLEGAREVISSVRTFVNRNRGPLQSAISNLRSAAESLDELGRELRNQPSRVLFGRPPKERDLP